ncbi:hypothetical protein [Streptacidiphilus melanogenes]|uniref:hypothetical protein n=1 Tax=Streptacidiphilus melanogenes TaxID=411235 RepID=UPI000694FF39|nr:hypothetical protein [Streptacidiphilus melanogenes]
MKLKSKAAKITAVAALGIGATILGSGTAFAGSNGQQIMFQDDLHVANSIELIGYNQAGVQVSHCVNTPGYQTWVGGYWWGGWVSVYAHAGSNCTGNQTDAFTAYIPFSQSGDWTTVSDTTGTS